MRLILAALALLFAAGPLAAADKPTLLLWPDGAPGVKGTEPADKPRLTVHLPEKGKANGAAVIVCPGGGYRVLAMVKEGHQVAEFFNSFGVTAFVLEYRLSPRYTYPAPLLDAQRAIRLVRSKAKEFGIDPHRLGIMGFSAGGHLTSMCGVAFDDGKPTEADSVEQQSCRPDFLVIAYPKIFFDGKADANMLKSFLGEPFDDSKVKEISSDLRVSDKTPPAFLFHTDEDRLVAENSVRFYLALRKAKVPAELHVYQKGPHGVGLALDDPELTTWKDHVRGWMRGNAWLTSAKPAALSGSVTIDGKPLQRGFVTLVPDLTHHQPPTVKTSVLDGKYQFTANLGPRPGRYTVAVTVFGNNDEPKANDLGAYHILKTSRPSSKEPISVEIKEGDNIIELDFALR